ncbi:MAG: hypothetical protein MOB07_07935 [Acidobacteria bacterium]|nr:hypothetical protein [Acidobacteriota bacterium]
MKKWSLLLASVLVISLAGLLVLPNRLTAQETAHENFAAHETRYRFQYSAKFFCTANIPGTSQTTPSVLPGSYQTVVSIHNPNDDTVSLRKKIAITFPAAPQQPGEVSKFIQEQLASDRAFQVDCDQIAKGFGITFIHGAEGFLVVESTHSLDVNAVYTAGKNGSGVESIAVEQVRERRVN